jgi:hypothetical protein
MNIHFITGSDAAFFNSLLIFLQSFAERMPGRRLLVCDFGFTAAQAVFLRGLGLLLERPPEFAAATTFYCKAGLLSYLRGGGERVDADTMLVWLDADLTMMEVGPDDFRAVATAMASRRMEVAICAEPLARSIGQVLASNHAMAPSVRAAVAQRIDLDLPYVSSGLFFCRSVPVLSLWQQLTFAVADSPLFEQNMFNVALHRDRTVFLPLDCEEWQAQGPSLDRVTLVPSAQGGRPMARIGDKNIKTLHATSGMPGHLLVATCRMTVRDLDLTGPFKLFLPEPLRLHQLQLLASFIVAHGEALRRLGICTPAARPSPGFEFVTL